MQVGWVLQDEDEQLPKWLADNLRSKCECGGRMENFYNKNGSITARRCSNRQCPCMMAQKIVGMCEILGVKGIGEATALKLVKDNKLDSHFGAIPLIFTRDKPRMTLYTYLRICFIQGIDTSWSSVVGDNENVQQLYQNYQGKYRYLLDNNKETILKGVSYVDFIARQKPVMDAIITGTVMISGNIRGFDNRNDFIGAINAVSKGAIRLGVSEHKRKTGILALIQESDTPNRGKAECALENGIPIMTPAQFQDYLGKRIQNWMAERRG